MLQSLNFFEKSDLNVISLNTYSYLNKRIIFKLNSLDQNNFYRCLLNIKYFYSNVCISEQFKGCNLINLKMFLHTLNFVSNNINENIYIVFTKYSKCRRGVLF